MKRALLVLALVLLAIGAAVTWRTVGARDASTGVDAAGAAEIVDGGEGATDARIEPGMRPDTGTWRYDGSGTEHLSLLGGSDHEFPETVYAVVKLDPDDECAWSLNLVFIEEHVEQRRYCTDDAGVTDRGFDRTTTFLGREQTSSYECSNAALRLKAGAKPGDVWRWTCREARGGLVRYTGTLVGTESVSIDGEAASTSHVRVQATQRDKSRGSERSDWWLLDTGLPAKLRSTRTLTTSAGPLGDLTTNEQFEYVLAAREPEDTDG